MERWLNQGDVIAVLYGGQSSERDVSLQTGEAVHKALVARGYDARFVDQDEGVAEALNAMKPKLVWNALHGTYGEDGAIQGLLEILGIPYTGSDVTASAIAMSKVHSKRIFQAQGIPTPKYRVLSRDEILADEDAQPPFECPVVVKPDGEGSSVGVSVVKTADDYAEALRRAAGYAKQVVVERFIPGKEVMVGLLSGKVLGTVEVRPKRGFYDYDAKYVTHDTEYLCPAPIDTREAEQCCQVALDAFRCLGCAGHARVDLRLSPEGGVYILEINTLPGMTDTSLLPMIAKEAGLSFEDLTEQIALDARCYKTRGLTR